MKGCNFTISASYLRLRLDLTRFDRLERFVRRCWRRRLEPPVAGGAGGAVAGGAVAGGAVAGGAVAGGAVAGGAFAALVPNPNRLVTEFNKLLEPLDISTLRQ
jgi:hypothetical protein